MHAGAHASAWLAQSAHGLKPDFGGVYAPDSILIEWPRGKIVIPAATGGKKQRIGNLPGLAAALPVTEEAPCAHCLWTTNWNFWN